MVVEASHDFGRCRGSVPSGGSGAPVGVSGCRAGASFSGIDPRAGADAARPEDAGSGTGRSDAPAVALPGRPSFRPRRLPPRPRRLAGGV